jgi:uncharacterized protein YceK
MKIIALIIVVQLMVALLSGCSEFKTLMEEKQLTCTPDAVFTNSCDGWKV